MRRKENSDPEIFAAIRAGKIDAAREMLRKEPGMVRRRSGKALSWNWEPAHWAAALGKSEAIELLLAFGADPNSRDCQGNSPAHIGALYGHPEVLRVLSRAGADLSALNERWQSPLDLALETGKREAADLLRGILDSMRERARLSAALQEADCSGSGREL